jgi:hypothetical protein
MATDKHLSIALSTLRQDDLNQPFSAAASLKLSSAGIATATPSSADRRLHCLAPANPQKARRPLLQRTIKLCKTRQPIRGCLVVLVVLK